MVVCLAVALSLPASAVGTGAFSPHPTTPSFGDGAMFSFTSYSSAVALGDLDGDTDLDAVVANHFGGAETVWRNDGSGNFSPHPTTPSFNGGFYSSDVALGDLDGDTDLDAVVANLYGGAETVWRNDGSGNFSPHPTTPSFEAGYYSFDVALGDLDGDTDLDAVVANNNGEAETVWRNDGSGNFSPHPTTPSFGAGYSTDVALGDLDGDTDLDAMVANTDGQPETVWRNDGSGNFSPHPTAPSFGASNSLGVALGDLDGDTDLDAVVANIDGQAETVWRNDGSGTFTPHPTTSSFGAGNSFDVALGDLDGDTDLDAVVANNNGEAETVWRNDGSGNFSPHPTTPSFGAGYSTDVALGDLDGDTDLDAVVANDYDEAETVWLNDGTTIVTTTTSTTIGTISDTTVSCTSATSASGAPLVRCTVTDPDGIRTVQVKNTSTNAQQVSLAFACSDAPTTATSSVPAGTQYKVFVNDCSVPRDKTSFVIRPNGTVKPV